jgi:hypothetical protein
MVKVKFKKLRFGRLPNGAHYFYCRKVSQEMASSPASLVSSLGTLPAQFNAALAEEKKWMDWVDQTILTDEIENADKRMDHAYTAIRKQADAQRYNPSQTIVEAAERIYTMLQKYGNVNRKAYEDQEGDILTILEQLQNGGAYYTDAYTIGITTQIAELQSAFTLFQQLLKQRDQKSLFKPDKTFKEVRHELEGFYYSIVELIDAGAALNQTSAYATFINDLNPEIERLNEEFNRVKIDIAHAEPEPIPPQTYSGRPLTPSTFKVLYVTPHNGTIQLELGKDYNLTFKDNTNVGNAECTIHGKGTYKGHKTVTFIIVRAM